MRPQPFEFVEVLHLPLAGTNAGEDVEHVTRADAARYALAAGLALGEVEKVAGEVHHAGALVHHDHAAGAHDGADLLDRVVVDRQVEILRREAAPGWSAELSGLEAAVPRDAAADRVDDFAERRSHRHLDQAGVLDAAGQGEDLRPGAAVRADAAIAIFAVEQNQGHVGEGFDVVDAGGLVAIAFLDGERRPRAACRDTLPARRSARFLRRRRKRPLPCATRCRS